MPWKIGLFISLIVLIVLFFVLHPLSGSKINLSAIQKPSPTPEPFYDLTIPYLRSKEYKSNLGNLDSISKNDIYETFLTSYTSDSLKINGLLTKPAGDMSSGGWPAIVFVHGYIPPKQYETQSRYIDYVDYLARNGFVVFKIDLRGNGNSQGDPGGAYYSSDYIIDTLNAYAALQSSDFVNPKRVGLWGHSMAGNIVSRSLAVKPDIPAAVIWAGAGYSYTDLIKYGISDASYQPLPSDTPRFRRRSEIRKIYGDPSDNNSFWKSVAATSYLNDLKGAIQINHAIDDQVVNIGYSRDLNDLLNKTKVAHQLNEYPSGGHNITGPSFSEAMANTVEFFKKYLK